MLLLGATAGRGRAARRRRGPGSRPTGARLELAAQAVGEGVVGGEGGGAVAALGEEADQVAVGGLGVRLDLDAAARPVDRAGGVGGAQRGEVAGRPPPRAPPERRWPSPWWSPSRSGPTATAAARSPAAAAARACVRSTATCSAEPDGVAGGDPARPGRARGATRRRRRAVSCARSPRGRRGAAGRRARRAGGGPRCTASQASSSRARASDGEGRGLAVDPDSRARRARAPRSPAARDRGGQGV